jgi:hypothetical protein
MASDIQAPPRPNPGEPGFMDEWDLEPKWLRTTKDSIMACLNGDAGLLSVLRAAPRRTHNINTYPTAQ